MKKFDIDEAREGKPYCTRDGSPVRIICWNAKGYCPIVALVSDIDGRESVQTYPSDGRLMLGDMVNPLDMMMKTEKKEGWLNIIKSDKELSGVDLDGVYVSEKDAREESEDEDGYITTIKIQWEE